LEPYAKGEENANVVGQFQPDCRNEGVTGICTKN
jgi:hypothetical protein